MVAAEADRIEGQGGGDPLRRVVLGVLALYLAPAVLIVLLVSLVGMACCAVFRLLGGGASRTAGRTPIRRNVADRGIPAPHVIGAIRSRSPQR